MKLIFLYGMPATGKLTVATELEKLTGYKLFHNHRVVDMLLSVFEFGSPAFVQMREDIWLSVFDRAGRDAVPGMIFTFAPETTVRPDFVAKVERVVGGAGGEILFVELTAPGDILRARMNDPSRRAHGKLISAAEFDRLEAAGVFNFPMPKPRLSLDTGRLSPREAAQTIAGLLA